MPRRLLRDGQIVADDWRYLPDGGEDRGDESGNQTGHPATDASATGSSNAGAAVAGAAADTDIGLIVPFDRWMSDKQAWLRRGGRLGVVLAPAQRVESLVEDLPALSLIAAEFPSPSEGRGYSQARLLRERWKFTGELRAIGHVRQDQLFFMARCGFNAFELPESEFDAAQAALQTFSAAYQSANDAGLSYRLRHRPSTNR
jgi:uncharacterized protein (DUF934 family)